VAQVSPRWQTWLPHFLGVLSSVASGTS
jgi:hypothetical protein